MKNRQEYDEAVADLLSAQCVQSMRQYMQHGRISTYEHCRAVSYYSWQLCQRLPGKFDYRALVRGAMLHDLFLYDWHIPADSHKLHGFRHSGTALRNARASFSLSPVEENVILTHMWPLTLFAVPRCREALAVCLVDKCCSLAETFGYRYPLPIVN